MQARVPWKYNSLFYVLRKLLRALCCLSRCLVLAQAKKMPQESRLCRQADRRAAGKRNAPGPGDEASQPVESGPRRGVGDTSGGDAKGGTDASAGLHNSAAADASRSAQMQAGVQSSGTREGGNFGLAAAAASASDGAQPAAGTQPCSEQRLPRDDNLRPAAAAPRAPANGVHAVTERGAGSGGEQPAGAVKAGGPGPGSPLVDAARTWGSAEGGPPAVRGARDSDAPHGQPSSQAGHRNGYVDSGSRKRAGRAPRALGCCCGRRSGDPAARPLHADANAPCARIIFICGLSARGRTEFYQARAHLWTCMDQSHVLGGQESV